MTNIRRLLFLLSIVYLSASPELFAQRTFEFNRQGSDCHMHFVCFTQNNEYNNLKRPFIFILGKPGQTPMESFEKDTLKNVPLFFDYEFVYIPNEGGSIRDRLFCLDALASYVTANCIFRLILTPCTGILTPLSEYLIPGY